MNDHPDPSRELGAHQALSDFNPSTTRPVSGSRHFQASSAGNHGVAGARFAGPSSIHGRPEFSGFGEHSSTKHAAFSSFPKGGNGPSLGGSKHAGAQGRSRPRKELGKPAAATDSSGRDGWLRQGYGGQSHRLGSMHGRNGRVDRGAPSTCTGRGARGGGHGGRGAARGRGRGGKSRAAAQDNTAAHPSIVGGVVDDRDIDWGWVGSSPQDARRVAAPSTDRQRLRVEAERLVRDLGALETRCASGAPWNEVAKERRRLQEWLSTVSSRSLELDAASRRGAGPTTPSRQRNAAYYATKLSVSSMRDIAQRLSLIKTHDRSGEGKVSTDYISNLLTPEAAPRPSSGPTPQAEPHATAATADVEAGAESAVAPSEQAPPPPPPQSAHDPWTMHTDPATGHPYYIHEATGESVWEKPTPSSPPAPPTPTSDISMFAPVALVGATDAFSSLAVSARFAAGEDPAATPRVSHMTAPAGGALEMLTTDPGWQDAIIPDSPPASAPAEPPTPPEISTSPPGAPPPDLRNALQEVDGMLPPPPDDVVSGGSSTWYMPPGGVGGGGGAETQAPPPSPATSSIASSPYSTGADIQPAWPPADWQPSEQPPLRGDRPPMPPMPPGQLPLPAGSLQPSPPPSPPPPEGAEPDAGVSEPGGRGLPSRRAGRRASFVDTYTSTFDVCSPLGLELEPNVELRLAVVKRCIEGKQAWMANPPIRQGDAVCAINGVLVTNMSFGDIILAIKVRYRLLALPKILSYTPPPVRHLSSDVQDGLKASRRELLVTFGQPSAAPPPLGAPPPPPPPPPGTLDSAGIGLKGYDLAGEIAYERMKMMSAQSVEMGARRQSLQRGGRRGSAAPQVQPQPPPAAAAAAAAAADDAAVAEERSVGYQGKQIY